MLRRAARRRARALRGAPARLRALPRRGRRAALAADTLPLAAPPVAPPPELRDRVMAMVRSEAELLHAAGPRADRPRRRASAAAPRALRRCAPRPLPAAGRRALRSLAGVIARRRARSAADDDAAPSPAHRAAIASAPAAPARRWSVVRRSGAQAARRAACPPPPRGRVYEVWLQARRRSRARPTDALFRVDATAARRSRCRAPEAASTRCSSPPSRDGGSHGADEPAGHRPPRSPPDAAATASADSVRRPHGDLLPPPVARDGRLLLLCGRPICPDCMTPTPVGHALPRVLARSARAVHTMRSTTARAAHVTHRDQRARLRGRLPGARRLQRRLAGSCGTTGCCTGPPSHFGDDYWRLVTSGFLHVGPDPHPLQHVSALAARHAARAHAGLARASRRSTSRRCCGARSARCVASPDALTVGASGAVFGLMGAAVVEQRARGIDPFKTDSACSILLNLVLTFVISGSRSAGTSAAWSAASSSAWSSSSPRARPPRARLPGLRGALGHRRRRRAGSGRRRLTEAYAPRGAGTRPSMVRRGVGVAAAVVVLAGCGGGAPTRRRSSMR